MSFSSWLRNWKRSLERRSARIQTHRQKSAAGRAARRIGYVRPRLEALEERLAPATLTVNSTADTVSGITSSLDLREAILLVNSGGTATDTSGNSLAAAKASQITGTFGVNDTIQFDNSLNDQTTKLNGSALPAITANMTITGLGANNLAISGNNQSGVFLVDAGVTASLSGLAIENGLANGTPGAGGIDNAGTLTVSYATLSGNSAGGGAAGGIDNDGTLTVTNSTIAGNSSDNGAGGIDNAGTLTVTNSTIAGNSSDYQGGGINNTGTLTVTNCTIADNFGLDQGGGINNFGTLTVTSSTIADNSTGGGAALAGYGGGIDNVGSATLDNTIVVGNISNGYEYNGQFIPATADDIGGSVNSASAYNLIGTGGSGGLQNGVNGNQVGIANPGLAPLGNYGGPTQTMALLPGSPAINAGTTDVPGITLNLLSTDQRGFARLSNGTVDIGAVEGELFTVTTTADSGPGSLRQAILDSNILDSNNANAGTDTIDFDIPLSDPGYTSATGTWTITPASALPAITVPVFLDGTSQPGYKGAPLIVLSGVQAGSNAVGLDVAGGNSTVKGLVINQFSSDGIDLRTIGGDVIEANYIGTDATGSSAAGNGGQGVFVSSFGNTIGGTTADARNIISGNIRNGVFLSGDAHRTVIEGNYIGTDVTGTTSVANGAGVTLYFTTGNSANTANNIIGGTAPGAGNLISGNSNVGIELYDSSDAVIQGNFIGTDKTGTKALGNGNGGILLYSTSPNNTIGGTAAGAGNVISGNAGPGVQIGGTDDSGTTGNVVQGNFIGTDVTGTKALANFYGVVVSQGGDQTTIGGTAAGARNVISGNVSYGITINGNSNVVQGNYIGVDRSGNAALGNGGGVNFTGRFNIIGVDSSNNPAAGNVISGNYDGVDLTGTYNVVAGNLIGLGADGSTSLGNRYAGVGIVGAGSDNPTDDNTIGGTTAAARNVISGNSGGGIIVQAPSATGNVIEGNYIGTDATGMAARPNLRFGGVWFLGAGANTLGGTAAGAANVISGNTDGVYLSDGTTGVQVEGNLIGVNAAGNAAVGNLYAGVVIDGVSGGIGNSPGGALNNTIGGTVAGAANIISGNGADALQQGGYDVIITPAAGPGNVIEGNYIGTGVTGTPAPPAGPPPTFVVTSTADPGPGSLRQAILQANAYYGTASISFDIPTSDPGYSAATGTWTITPASALPVITEGVVLDATTQRGYTGRPAVELDGAGTSSGASGLYITGSHAVIKGLDIGGFSGDGIDLIANGGNVIAGDYIGTDPSGEAPLANSGNGILIEDGSSNNTIGGTASGAGNVISGNAGSGVLIWPNYGAPVTGNVVQGNFIGTDATGTVALPNLYGVYIDGSNGNTIGGTAAGARNVISGNVSYGITINGNSNVVQGNYIGVDRSGNAALGNGGGGVNFTGRFNIIGVDSSNNPAAGNVISGNQADGVDLTGNYNVIAGNLIGLGGDGSTMLGNRGDGVGIVGGGSDNPTDDNTIGGTTAAARNVISGNSGGGIIVQQPSGTGNVIEGNYIGTDATGTLARLNGRNGGVWFLDAGANTLGGTAAGAGNVISGNINGVYLSNGTTGVQIEGNLIGVNATGTAALGNQGAGVLISGSTNNTIGGTAAGAGNAIAFNTAGVVVQGANTTGDSILGNSIHDNNVLGIQLASGANNNQAAPVLTSAISSSSGTTVSGTLASTANTTFRIEFFSNADLDTSGNVEGLSYLGFANVTTDASGNASFTASLPVLPSGENYLSATATNLTTGDTSQFSKYLTVPTNLRLTLQSSSVNEGSYAGLSGSFVNPNPVDNSTVVINWGDGSANTTLNLAAGVVTFSGVMHQYLDQPDGSSSGSYPISVTVTDNEDGQTSAGTSIQVNSVLPTASVSGPTLGVPGQPRTFTFSASTPSPTDQAAGFTYAINWGDGSTQTIAATAGNGAGVGVDHIYTATGSYTITVTAADDDTVSQTASWTISVQTVEMEGNSLAVGGNLAGGDTIIVSAADTSGTYLNVTIDKQSLGYFTATDHIFVYGQGGKDKIELKPFVVGNNTYYYIKAPAFLYGEGSGGDKLDARGSQANNVLVGHGVNEALTGGLGRDLLIAGTGSATLNAGSADDILIGGWTNYDIFTPGMSGMTYDQKLIALEAIMAEWGSADSYATRISDLVNGGGQNGSFLLNPSTVHDNGQVDYLYGASTKSAALDWYFAGITDQITSLKNGEEVESIS